MMIDNVIARICHDLLSPINGLSLFLETVEDEIPNHIYKELSEYIGNFNKTILLFRMLGMQNNVTVVLPNVVSVISNYAEQFDTACSFTHYTISEIIPSPKAKLIIYMYIIAQKIVGKSGTINFALHEHEITVTITSNNPLQVIDEKSLENNNINALLTLAFENCKKITNDDIKQINNGNISILSIDTSFTDSI